jgi:hypothetical protein
MDAIKMSARLLVLGIAAAGVVAVGCGGDDSTASRAAVAPTENSPAKGYADPADIKMPPIAPTEPRSSADQLAAKIELPAFYPSDAPVYPNTPPSKAFIKGKIVNLMFGTKDAANQVLDFMKSELPRLGWKNAVVEKFSNVSTMSATKPGRELTILVTELDAGTPSQTTLIAISVTAD